RLDEVEGRVCDDAAIKLGELTLGLPPYHPLLKDADARLRAVRETFDRYRDRWKRLGPEQTTALGSRGRVIFAPTFEPLGRAATAEDVTEGRAVFHFGGRGRLADEKLPAVRELPRDGKKAERVLVVQAEVSPEGVLTYGICCRDGIRSLPASGVRKVTPPRP